jgi:regulatory protein
VIASGEPVRVETDGIELVSFEQEISGANSAVLTPVEAPDDPATGGPDDEHADPEEVARTIVLRKLAAKARTRHELRQALQARKVPSQASDAVLDRMEEVGLIDDAAFAVDWVTSRQQRRHLSAAVIRQELRRKGVDRDQIDAALDHVDASAEFEAAFALAERKAAAMHTLPRDVRYRRLAGSLARRGFDPGMITQVLAQVLGGR